MFFSCATNRNIILYDKIDVIKKEYNKNHQNDIVVLISKDFNPTKIIIRKLKFELKNDNIIYVFSWANTMPTTRAIKFRALLYDINTQKKYYISNSFENYKNIVIEFSSDDFKGMENILSFYLKKESDNLKNFTTKDYPPEMTQDYYIFDTENNKVLILNSIVFDKDGNPH
ncbi:hypothetical protein ACM44_13630 [Chryseobacterium koreense CCUG 49689]|uniref:Uncharacterized protein n=2 Tax=Chryseobacterium koreense TaxID=232216 RepID=A0A0J7LM93_9FLAO|nr:hypothetical protein ACM44_13630 [Chryseobacterium koreense CCUG 49689]